jgi:hypothetical protein
MIGMCKPHWLHLGLSRGSLTMRLSCPGDCGQWTIDSYDEETGEVTFTEPRRCWVTNDAAEAFDDMGVWDALEDLDIDEITGPIPVRVWNEGDFEECIPRMGLWPCENFGPVEGLTEGAARCPSPS